MLGRESPGPADGAPIIMLLTPLAAIGDLKSTFPRSQVAQRDEGPGKLKVTSSCVIVCRSYGRVAVPALFKWTPKVGRTARSALLAGGESDSAEGSQAPGRMAPPYAGLLECAVRRSAPHSHAPDLWRCPSALVSIAGPAHLFHGESPSRTEMPRWPSETRDPAN